jgi:hypothetical protein
VKRLEFRTVTDWAKHAKREGPSKSMWQEVVWREHGAPGQAIQLLIHRNLPATLDALLAECEHYDRQEYRDNPLWFVDGEYVRDRVIIDLGKLIEAGLVWSVEVEV